MRCYLAGLCRYFLGVFLQFGLIEGNRGSHEGFQCAFVDLATFKKVDGASRVAVKARIEELVRISEVRTVRKGQFYLALVGIGDRDHAIARPNGTAHPFPFFDDFGIGRENGLADGGESFSAPVRD